MFHYLYGINIAVRARAGVLTIADRFASSEAYASMLVVFANEDRFNLLCGPTLQEISQCKTMLIPAIWVIFPIHAFFSDVKIKFEYAESVEMQCSLGMKLAGGEGQSKMVI